ncbi:hypothetical protein KIM96_18985, partial [Vibrio cholerae]|uniref:hypothetical protein n=1 Tax=Vibrio cholerae TaxID=666 RepID=UPI001BCBE10A
MPARDKVTPQPISSRPAAMKDFQDIDAHLEDWSTLRAAVDFSGILIGNGASRTIWEDFAYDSLFENARTVEE